MHGGRNAFTLVEILIVVIILAVLAGIVIPNITGVTTVSRETNLKENLSKIRAHIQIYRNQHGSFPDGEDFADQMTKHTDFSGDVAETRDDTHRFGPYIEQMPPNPITGSSDVRVEMDGSAYFPAGDEDGGWWYNETNGRFFADLTAAHVDTEGNYYNQY
jgi:general secretion pathway protein G